MTYRIDVTNNGPSKALNVIVVDDLPATKQAIYQSDTGGCVLSTPSRLTCNQGDLAVGECDHRRDLGKQQLDESRDDRTPIELSPLTRAIADGAPSGGSPVNLAASVCAG